MPIEIDSLLNFLFSSIVILLIVAVLSSIMMTPKVVKHFVDTKIFIKQQTVKRIYDDEKNKFPVKLSEEQLRTDPNPQIRNLAMASDYTLRVMCKDLKIPNYSNLNKRDKILAIIAATKLDLPIDAKSTPDEIEKINELEVDDPKNDGVDDDPDDDPIVVEPVEEEIMDARTKRTKQLDKLSTLELHKIAKSLKIKYFAKMKKQNLINQIIDTEIDKSIANEGDPMKSITDLKEGK